MSEILSIEKLREMATPIIEVPDFENKGTIKIRVQRPRLLAMASEGKIPNYLMDSAMALVAGKSKEKKKLTDAEFIKEIDKGMELYCIACMVEPTYEEMKDILTDEQKSVIFDWGLRGSMGLENFRTDKENGTGNDDGKEVSEKTQ
ncbi:hypothetical protein [Tissierella sp.]|uniref:hypothetical protein n=1 Tax=Tissierella sp. TaxID=41274 RepID=UPI0028AFADF6|nr:hypothetical protein [Tissierella sp.]